MKTRTELINWFIKEYGYKSYLEIGYGHGENYHQIECYHKEVVEPYGDTKAPWYHKMTSTKFFESFTTKYDLIFIDGSHWAKHVAEDIENSLKHLNEGGTIILHDCNPEKYEHQTIPPSSDIWNGDVWKAVVTHNVTDPNSFIRVLDIDYGCGILRREVNWGCLNADFVLANLSWENFELFRTSWLNLIDLDRFYKLYSIKK